MSAPVSAPSQAEMSTTPSQAEQQQPSSDPVSSPAKDPQASSQPSARAGTSESTLRHSDARPSDKYKDLPSDPLALPSKEKLREIAARQDAKEREILAKREEERSRRQRNAEEHGEQHEEGEGETEKERRRKAAERIQVGIVSHRLSSEEKRAGTEEGQGKGKGKVGLGRHDSASVEDGDQQHASEDEGRERRRTSETECPDAADALEQRNYRGYRSRREMGGRTLSSTIRWKDAMREAQYRNITQPRARADGEKKDSGKAGSGATSSPAKDHWRRAGKIVRQAENDDTSDTDGSEGMSAESLASYRRRKKERKAEREEYAKTMGLEYFLEMVDQKHRYGSSLRRYHEVWQQSTSKDNFFYWLDQGSGLRVDLEDRPRKRLDEEQIRYLSREERKKYLVNIGDDGLFYWAKDGKPITTSPDFRDSVDGIVPMGSKTPTWREKMSGKDEASSAESSSDDDSDASSLSGISVGHNEEPDKYTNQALHDAKGVDKVRHLSAGALMNRLLRKTTKKNTWIFVADTSFRLYVGIKQSGAFQHSSFLHGARVSAAGLIRIKRGQLRKLDPLSGHYAPPVRNFRGFVHNLRDAGADMAKVNISRSYAILVGLETYVGAKKKIKRGEQRVVDIFRPEEKRAREERGKDKSESAEKERRTLERERRAKEQHVERGGAPSVEDESGNTAASGTEVVLRKLGVKGQERSRKVPHRDGSAETVSQGGGTEQRRDAPLPDRSGPDGDTAEPDRREEEISSSSAPDAPSPPPSGLPTRNTMKTVGGAAQKTSQDR